MAEYEIPGAGIVVPSRKTATMPSVNRIFLRRSGVARAERNALNTRGTSSASSAVLTDDRLGRHGAGRTQLLLAGKPGTLRGTLVPKRVADSNSFTARVRSVCGFSVPRLLWRVDRHRRLGRI